MHVISFIGPYHSPVYSIDFSNSIYTSYAFENNQHVFTVEQGTRFYLKLNLSANPIPKSSDLAENGNQLQRAPWGRIYLGMDSVNIQSVQYTDAANYSISCSNFMGEGRFTFRLNIVGKAYNFIYTYPKPNLSQMMSSRQFASSVCTNPSYTYAL